MTAACRASRWMGLSNLTAGLCSHSYTARSWLQSIDKRCMAVSLPVCQQRIVCMTQVLTSYIHTSNDACVTLCTPALPAATTSCKTMPSLVVPVPSWAFSIPVERRGRERRYKGSEAAVLSCDEGGVKSAEQRWGVGSAG